MLVAGLEGGADGGPGGPPEISASTAGFSVAPTAEDEPGDGR